jgi:hypothetical protein
MTTHLLLRLYDWFARHRFLRLALPLVLVLAALASASQLHFKEDITDFLPNNDNYRRSMEIYRQTNAADRIFIVASPTDTTQLNTPLLVRAMQQLEGESQARGWKLMAQADVESVMRIPEFAYQNAPLLLGNADFERIKRITNTDSIRAALQSCREMLLFPTGGMVTQNIERDPLGLFTPLLAKLQASGNALRYELYDGYIFTPNSRHAVAMLTSPYGASETSSNAQLVMQIDSVTKAIEARLPGVQFAVTGAPVIAVDNASQIKKDSIWAIAIAATLIVVLLVWALRRARHLLLILLSLGFGWLMAMGGMALVSSEVSIIVLGIASVIIGIAVNYPLHFVTHLGHCASPRQTLEEIASPLVVGNVTTVGAFAALIPLDATALSHLGIFAAMMLVSTILFVVVFLPHFVGKKDIKLAQNDGAERSEPVASSAVSSQINLPASALTPRQRRQSAAVAGVLVTITLVLGYFSLGTQFDTDLRNINYLTPQQQTLLAQMAQMRGEEKGTTPVYFVAEANNVQLALQAAEQSQYPLLVASVAEQQRRLQQWHSILNHRAQQLDSLSVLAASEGFAPDAFKPFQELLKAKLTPQLPAHFAPLLQASIGNRIMGNTVVNIVNVPSSQADSVASAFKPMEGVERWAFTLPSLNATIANSLSQHFNYIGWVCGAIVFVFLWLSFRKFKLAVIAFMPMVVSWLWILGTMHLLDMRFNLVNIILATFIFGQGDDYSIFVTEGLIYERKHGKPMLAAYRKGILLSAAIMFIGMGSLVVARHPALHSLGAITIVGMGAVVALTYVVPPLLFKWWVK